MFDAKSKEIFNKLMSKLPTFWDGKKTIEYMRNNGCTNWKQMEWPGWYFQFMCESILKEDDYFEIPGKRYGKVEFDGFHEINYDFKAHSEFEGSSPKVPTNGFQEVQLAIKDTRTVGFIVACGFVDFDDETQSFKNWHDQLKGKTSKYEEERVSRGAPSRRRKVSFKLQKIVFLFVDESNLKYTASFQGGMRNSNGVARNPKVMIDLNDDRFEKHVYEVK